MSTSFIHEERSREASRTQAVVMGVAVSAIAFAMHQTADRALSVTLILPLLAVLAWAACFVFGLQNSHAKQAAMELNLLINDQEREGTTPTNRKKAWERFNAQNDKARKTYRRQLIALLIGALLYVAGHGAHIFEKAAGTGQAALKTK